MIKSKYLIAGSLLVFILNFFTLLNLQFTTNKSLQTVGYFIALVAAFFFVVGVLSIRNPIKNRSVNKEETEGLLKSKKEEGLSISHPKRFIAILMIIWIFVSPFISNLFYQQENSLLTNLFSEKDAGSFIGSVVIIVLMLPTLLTSYYFPFILTPYVVFLLLYLVILIYFFFSKGWHRLLDSVLSAVIAFLIFGQFFIFSR